MNRMNVPEGINPRETDSTSGAALIAQERQRQITTEGWTPEHDDGHEECQLLDAAICYAGMSGSQIMDNDGGIEARVGLMEGWPWSPDWWKPSDDPIRNLVKAGALIAAEIDRLQRGKVGTAIRERNEGK